MIGRFVLALAVAVAAVGCGGEEAADTQLEAGPQQVVQAWLAAVDELDLADINRTTFPPNVALVAGSENGFTVEQMEAIVESGLPSATARSYWTSFRTSFLAFLGADVGELTVVGVEEFAVSETMFAAVRVSQGGAESEILAQQRPEGWVVDMLATAGPPLSVQIRRLVADIVAEGADEVAFAYATMAVASLGAALERAPDNRALELELEAIEDLPIDLSR